MGVTNTDGCGQFHSVRTNTLMLAAFYDSSIPKPPIKGKSYMNNQRYFLSPGFIFANILMVFLIPNSAWASSMPQVAAGSLHSLALDSTGNVYYWGATYGGNPSSYNLPTKAPNLSNIIAISAADTNSLALRADGVVFRLYGVSGTSIVQGLPAAMAISQGSNQAFAITNTGDVWSWGGNTNCGLGLGITQDSNIKAPAKISGLSNIVSIAAGSLLSSASDSSGNIYVWGCLPDSGGGYIFNYATPTLVKSIKSPKAYGLASLLSNDGFAVSADGNLWVWNGLMFAYLAIQQNPALLTNPGLYLDILQPIAVPNVNDVARISSDPEDNFLYWVFVKSSG